MYIVLEVSSTALNYLLNGLERLYAAVNGLEAAAAEKAGAVAQQQYEAECSDAARRVRDAERRLQFLKNEQFAVELAAEETLAQRLDALGLLEPENLEVV